MVAGNNNDFKTLDVNETTVTSKCIILHVKGIKNANRLNKTESLQSSDFQ